MGATLLTAVAAGYLLGLSGYFAALVSGRARSGILGAAREVTPCLFLPLPVLVALAVFVRAPFALVLSVSALVFAAVALEPRHPLRRSPPGPPAGATSFRIMTLNAGGNAAPGDPVSVERSVRSIDADVVALQELTPSLLAHLRRRFAGRYPYWHGSWPAVVFSRLPIRSGRCLRFPSPGFVNCPPRTDKGEHRETQAPGSR
ncbi:MAG: hypothetical protein J2P45_05640 [Candidatus Dormibacteraeota bacterium]|nr:hypothetical protein [Candidatus Dormibacteraeota bacterium]